MIDFKSIKTIEEQDRMLEDLWASIEDVPMDPDTECLEEPVLGFPAGTPREDIWHWFDERYSRGVAHLLYHDGVDRTDITAKTVFLRGFCVECESETCVYNHEGECRYALVHENKPTFTEEDGCISGVIGCD